MSISQSSHHICVRTVYEFLVGAKLSLNPHAIQACYLKYGINTAIDINDGQPNILKKFRLQSVCEQKV